MSRILVDNSVIVKSLKGNEKALKLFRSIKDEELAINPIVFSEVVYIFMRYGKKDVNKVLDLLNSFIMLDLTKEIVKIAENYIVRFKLFPNDSLILDICKYYGFSIAILDSDFEACCKSEGIEFIGGCDVLQGDGV